MLRLSYMVMQGVNHQLFTEKVIEEVMLGTDYSDNRKFSDILDKLAISAYKERHRTYSYT